MKARFFARIVVLFTVSAFAGKAFAQTFTNGDWTYILNDSNAATIVGFSGTSSGVVIPAELDGFPVKKLFGNVFRTNATLTSVTIPPSVTGMGSGVFYGCSNLSAVSMGINTTNIGDYSFYGCSALTNITIPYGVTAIGEYSFANCSNLQSISIPGSVDTIGSAAFAFCSSLCQLNISSGVRRIASSAFWHCANLTNFVMPDTITQIDAYAFENCTALTDLAIPDSVFAIGQNAFLGCTGLKTVVLGAGIRDLGYNVFAQCSNLAEVSIANGVEHLTSGLFTHCTSLTSVSIPSSVRSIDAAVFLATKLSHVEIPANVTNIGHIAFAANPNLKSVLFLGNAPTSADDQIFDSIPTIYYYANATGWSATFAGRPTVALVGNSYSNSLTDQVSLNTDFTFVQVGSGGSFSADTNGLSLSTSTVEGFAAGYALKQKLPTSSSWTATAKCHVSEFAANQTNPWFYGALMLLKNGFTEQDLANNPVVELKFVRAGEGGLTNSVSWKNDSKDQTFYHDKLVPKEGVTDLFLSFSYVADTATLTAKISGDGVLFTNVARWELGEVWGLSPGDVLTVAIAAGSEPFGGASATHQVQMGDIYLRDFSVSMDGNTGSPYADTDGDGLSDLAEQSLSSLGFDWMVTQPELVSGFTSNMQTAGFFTQVQYDSNRTSGIAEGRAQVTGDPASYGLYTSNSIMDLRMGGLMIQKQGINAVVSFQPQTTTDLAYQPFTNNGTPITHEVPMPGNKGFIRINAKPGNAQIPNP